MTVWFIAGILSGGALVGVAFACLSAGSYEKGFIDGMNEAGMEGQLDEEAE